MLGVCGLLSFQAVCSKTEIPLKITELNQLITLIYHFIRIRIRIRIRIIIIIIIIIIINLYLPSAVFIAQVLVGPSKQLKKIFQIEHNIVENPNWPEANQLAIYKRGRGFELGVTEKQTQVVVRAGLEPGTAGLRVRRADHSATLPPRPQTPCMGMSTANKTNRI